MEVALVQAKKSCPFLHVASASSLRRLSTLQSKAAKPGSALLNKAQQCPVMSQAIQTRGISTSRVVTQKPTTPVKAKAVEQSEVAPGIKKTQDPCLGEHFIHPFFLLLLLYSASPCCHRDRNNTCFL